MTDDPQTYSQGDAVILECEGEKYLSEIVMASSNGRSLMLKFEALVAGHLGMMALLYQGDGNYVSIINGVSARVSPLPNDWLKRKAP